MLMNSEHEIYLKNIKKKKIKITVLRISILIIFIALWEIAARLKWIDPFLTSSPTRIVNSLVDFMDEGTLLRHIWVTCYETIVGFVLGTIVGTIMAIILWSFPTRWKPWVWMSM